MFAITESQMFSSNLFGYEPAVPLYNTGNGFAYDFTANPGAFFFMGPPGVFDFGFNRLNITDSNENNIDPTIPTAVILYFDFNDSNIPSPFPAFISGSQHAQLYLNSNSALLFTPNFNAQNAPDYFNVLPSNELVITRLSTKL